LKPEHIEVLHDIVTERAQASLQEIADEMHHRCGLRMCAAVIRRALRVQGIVRLSRYDGRSRRGSRVPNVTAVHRREDISPYSTNLTAAEWALDTDLSERVPWQRGELVYYH